MNNSCSNNNNKVCLENAEQSWGQGMGTRVRIKHHGGHSISNCLLYYQQRWLMICNCLSHHTVFVANCMAIGDLFKKYLKGKNRS